MPLGAHHGYAGEADNVMATGQEASASGRT
jgi:hypothetical protein